MRRLANLSTGTVWNAAVAATLVAAAAATLRALSACWRIELLGGFSYGIVVSLAFAGLFVLLHRAAARAAPGDRLPYAGAGLGRRALVATILLGRAAVFGAMLAVALTSFFGPIARPVDRLLLDFDRPLHMGPYREALLARATAVWQTDGARTGDPVLDGLLARAVAGAEVMTEVFDRVRALPPLAVRIERAETELSGQHRARLVVVSARTPGGDVVWGRLRRNLRYEWFCVGGFGGTAVDEVRPAVLRLPNDPIVDRNVRLTVDLPPTVLPAQVEVRVADRLARVDGYSRGGERVQVGFGCPLPREVEQVPIEVRVDGRTITQETFALARGCFAVDDRIGLQAWPVLAEIFGPDCAMRPPLGGAPDVAWVDATASLPTSASIGVVRGEVVRRERDSRLLPRPALVSSAYGRAGVWLASGTDELPYWRSAVTPPGEVLVAMVDAQGSESVVVASPGPGLVTVVLPPDDVLRALPTKQQRALARLMLLATGIAHRSRRGDESMPVLRLDLDLRREAAEQLQAGPSEVAASLMGQLWHLLATDTPGGAYTPSNTIRPDLAWILFGLLALLVGPYVMWRVCAALRVRSA